MVLLRRLPMGAVRAVALLLRRLLLMVAVGMLLVSRLLVAVSVLPVMAMIVMVMIMVSVIVFGFRVIRSVDQRRSGGGLCG